MWRPTLRSELLKRKESRTCDLKLEIWTFLYTVSVLTVSGVEILEVIFDWELEMC